MSTEEQNKATFRRYIKEIWNQGRLELADEIFDRYISHQADGLTLQPGLRRDMIESCGSRIS